MELKIAVSPKIEFSKFYDIKEYKKHMSEQFVVSKYSINNQKIIVDKEK